MCTTFWRDKFNYGEVWYYIYQSVIEQSERFIYTAHGTTRVSVLLKIHEVEQTHLDRIIFGMATESEFIMFLRYGKLVSFIAVPSLISDPS